MQHSTHRGPESGTILIIVLFCLTLLLTIGVLMILNSGTESLLNSNYRTSTQAFYAAMSGLEEARGRLSPRHPDSISGVVAAAGTPLFYGLTAASTAPSLNVTSNGRQAFELTALAVLPNGSKRLLQYVITPAPLGYSIPSLGAAFLPFPSPLTLVGPVGTFQASNDANLWMNGSDQQSGGNCSPVESLKPAIGV